MSAVMPLARQTVWLADTYTPHSGPQWTSCSWEKSSVITPGAQPTPGWSTSSQRRRAAAAPSPRQSTRSSCWPSCSGWPGWPAAVSTGPTSIWSSLSGVSILQVRAKPVISWTIVLTSSGLSSHLVSQPENAGGKIPVRLLQPESVDFYLASEQHPGSHWASCRPWWVKYSLHQVQLDCLNVLRLVSCQSRGVVDALHSDPLRRVPHHLCPPTHSPLLRLSPPDSLPGAGWGLHWREFHLLLLREVLRDRLWYF